MKSVWLTCWLFCGVAIAQIPVEEEPDHHAGFHNDLVYVPDPLAGGPAISADDERFIVAMPIK